ncbi:MAG: PKD domain-containing protein [Bacteroidales bacterium]|nr:PKD domain-containing protein [Bacteroidales bacterium]
MKKVLTFVLFIALAFAVNAQTAGAGPLVICGEGESCPPDYNGHFSSGIVPYAPDVNSEYFPIIRACEPLEDVCITMHCPQSIDLSAVGLGSNTINLRGIEVKGFGGLPEGVSYCLSDANWVPDGYYTIHLTGTPMQAGTYQLKLSAVLSGGTFLSVNTDLIYPNGMDAIQVTVQEATPLVAGFTADATEITAGTAVNFTNTSTGYQATRTWTFEGGNPATSTDENPRVIYSTPGTYRVSLTVTNACGENTKTEETYITVTEPQTGEPPVADFYPALYILAEGFKVEFTDLSTNLPTSWSWTFENGTPATSTEQNPVVTYAEEGDFLVTLVAENEYGRDSIARTINITGINDYNVDDMVSVYPNPASSILNIEAENLISVTILDMSGKIVYFALENCSATSIDLSGFANAEYVVKVETENGRSLKRIIKTR